jgi:phosphoenolpyruvate synthase/pyruvate phosphate dikinase
MKINKEIIKKIIKRMPAASTKYAVRDVSFLSCSVFIQTYLLSFKKFFGFDGFSVVFWHVRPDRNAVYHRSGYELDNFSAKVGKRYLRDFKFAKKTAATLVKLSDDIHEFIRKNKTKEAFLKNRDNFFELYRDSFAFHQAVYWPTDYLLKNKSNKNSSAVGKVAKVMDRAYKYNEIVIPDVDKYFSRLKIGEFALEEVGKTKRPGRRSILLLDGQVEIIPSGSAEILDRAIRKNYEKYLSGLKSISGLAVSQGKAIGKVRLVKSLEDLRYCQSGDVLVVTQTRPQYNTFIKKVKAIVTDEGGLLCHASMLAREFKVPCVVGTKNATKVLKDGMIVEVNAYEGVIKILK